MILDSMDLMTKQLDKTFNISPVEVSDTPEGGCATRKDQLTNVTKPDRLSKDDIEKDYEYTRGYLIVLLKRVKKQLMVF